ncbi:hypothetical protein SD71_10965 [Cohnella kolymensis]|uniref:Uncharacterized protein n=1 Tax=Cohnella kolymensis TaxID=1590652 RepID=A0ABR5A5H2_9BACL|nr:hypothetical protein SD71_10965 [Cohnella kolymensis]
MARSQQYILTWSVSLFLSLIYFVYYIWNFASNVPMIDSVLVFIQYYLIFVLMFGILFYIVCRLMSKIPLLNVLTISIAHLLFMFLLFHSLDNLDAGSFFQRAP